MLSDQQEFQQVGLLGLSESMSSLPHLFITDPTFPCNTKHDCSKVNRILYSDDRKSLVIKMCIIIHVRV